MRVLAGLTLYLAAEVAVLWLVGAQLGFLGLVTVLVASAFIGTWAVGHEGRRSLRALAGAARSGRPADAELADGMIVAAAGVLLVLPGLIGDAVGLVLLVPPVRRTVARRVVRSAQRRVVTVTVPPITVVEGGRGAPGPRRPWAGRVIEGEVVDHPEGDRRTGPGDTAATA